MCSERDERKGRCSERDKERNMFGKGHRKGCVPFLMRVGTCKGTEGKVFANMSAGADRKANTRESLRATGGVHKRWQRGVALQALGESGCSLGAKFIPRETASTGAEVGDEVSVGIDTKANTRAAAHSRLVICVSLRMAASAEAPLSPMSLFWRLRARGGVGMVRE